ncbi:hypothetical protein BD311DRAFT_340986 [Dichomitus squalens]|uniref:Uncharacterized protein n=1 Tax=Dichomitus squalens TaxID=114155 RepID=A0A4Q9N2H6_9APHY|nr:hypothetical protein BD311DRAFT_340986 [Dichomitus squalens]
MVHPGIPIVPILRVFNMYSGFHGYPPTGYGCHAGSPPTDPYPYPHGYTPVPVAGILDPCPSLHDVVTLCGTPRGFEAGLVL